MFVAIENTPRPYPWGATSAIATLLGTTPSGGPEAELWLGSHAGSPSRVVDPTLTGGHDTLAGWIELPFLLKVLAAASPLSLQAHPSTEQARAGFTREEEAGVPLDAPNRNYKDPSSKPEMIIAVNDGFEALCGFRDPAEARVVFARLTDRSDRSPVSTILALLDGPDPVRTAFTWLLAGTQEQTELVDELCAAAASVQSTDDDGPEFALVRRLAEIYPRDPGIAVSVLLNQVTLSAGEALWLPAGNIHAYLGGLGIELMAASDNVLRGGLTTKHIDVPELLAVLDFAPIEVPRLAPQRPQDGVSVFAPAGSGLALAWVAAPVTLQPASESIVLALSDGVTVSGSLSSVVLNRGGAMLVTADEHGLSISGGECVVAATGLTATS